MGNTQKEIGRFVVAGISAVSADVAAYYALLNFLSYAPSKTISFLSGTVVAYVINKYWTFEKREQSCREMGSFLALYIVTMGVNVGVNALSLTILEGAAYYVSISFLAATAASTILNFIGQKWWVFANIGTRKHNESQ